MPNHAPHATEWWEAGYAPIPINGDGTKRPLGAWREYTEHRMTRQQLDTYNWADAAGIGVVCGDANGHLEMLEFEGRAATEELPAKYADLLRDHDATELWQRITEGLVEISPSGGIHYHYTVTGGDCASNTKLAANENRETLIETRGQGGFVVVAPTGGHAHPSGKGWTRIRGDAKTIPTISVEERDLLFAVAAMLDRTPATGALENTSPAASLRDFPEGHLRPGDDFNHEANWADILEPEGWQRGRTAGRSQGWVRPGKQPSEGISATTGNTDNDNLHIFTSSTIFEEGGNYSKFGAYALLHHGGDWAAATKQLAKEGYGDPLPEPTIAAIDTTNFGTKPVKPVNDGQLATVTELKPRGRNTMRHSDDGNATALVSRHSHEIRYIADAAKWLHWTGTVWKISPDGAEVAQMHLNISAEMDDKTEAAHKRRSLSSAGTSASLALAGKTAAIRIARSDLDQHRWKLNTPSGIVDMRTGNLGAPDPAQLHTKTTTVGPKRALTPRFNEFLADTFQGDQELVRYVQQLLGYAATGSVEENILPFFFGSGANGKSVLLEVVRSVLGTYAGSAPVGMLMARQNAVHEAEIARLSGLRLVICSEVNEQDRFDEAKVKTLTGGDAITARFMYEGHFDFEPTHTLFLMGNNRPRVTSGGDSFWRRARLVGFDHTVPESERVSGLARQLIEAEGAGILQWIIDGAVDYTQHGLVTPSKVVADTKEYAESEDDLARFIDDCVELTGDDDDRIENSEMRSSYEAWCLRNGEKEMTPQMFGRRIQGVPGVGHWRSNGLRFRTGVRWTDLEQSRIEKVQEESHKGGFGGGF